MEHFLGRSVWYGNSMKKSDLTAKQKLFVPCPVCAMGAGKQCRMYSGFARRNEAHSERKYFAMQTIEHDYGGVTQIARARGGASSDSL
jgi:hypothetical protein